MAGLFADLSVAGKLAASAVGRRLRSEIEAPPDLDQFSNAMQQVVDATAAGAIKETFWIDIPGNQPPWISSDLQVEAGDEISYFCEGRAYINRFFDIYVSASLQLWCKLGPGGEIFRGTRSSHSFRASHAGPLMFGNYFPNDWADLQGSRVENDEVYKQVSGGFRVLAIRWQGPAEEGLRTLLQQGDPGGRISAELQRIEAGELTPQGWHYLWHLGPAEIYRQGESPSGEPCIHCNTSADVGILQKEADLPLTPDTEISWRWCVEQLPSTLREDTVPSHDYLSIAVEFDNGKDITYYWSNSLPEGTGYDCPLPNWQGKEFHVVVRSGAQGLGSWLDERRNLHADYQHYIGTPPARVVRVWLIANSIFQRKPGSCDYADIRLHQGGEISRIL
jgi:hypothetical protein